MAVLFAVDVDPQDLTEQDAHVLSMTLWVPLRSCVSHADVKKAIRPKDEAAAVVILGDPWDFHDLAGGLPRVSLKAVVEGANEFSNRFRQPETVYVPPIFSYSHRIGVSVTGGFVYHGQRAPTIQGWYVFADFETRRVWALTQSERRLQKVVEIGRAPTRAVSITQLHDGELCLVGFDAGVIYRLGLENIDPKPLRKRSLVEAAEQVAATWQYTEQAPAAEWLRPEFDDTGWSQGPAGFGTQGTPGAVVRTEWRSREIWLRREFTLPESFKAEGNLMLHVHHDEDAEVYLNGENIARLNRWTSGYVDLPLDESAQKLLRPRRNVLAIHCRQNSGGQYIDAGFVEFVGDETLPQAR